MLKTRLEHGDLKFSNELIYDLVSSIIIEIPGVCRLKNYKISGQNNGVKKKIKHFNKKKGIISKDAIDIKWDNDKHAYELCLYVILNDLHNIHVITNSIYDRITFEFKDKLKISNLNLKIYIEDFEDNL